MEIIKMGDIDLILPDNPKEYPASALEDKVLCYRCEWGNKNCQLMVKLYLATLKLKAIQALFEPSQCTKYTPSKDAKCKTSDNGQVSSRGR